MPVDQRELANTLKRIKTSLNKRYEKDAELYISYQDTLVIKKHLYNKEYAAIKDMVRNGIHSSAIVSRVIAKNLWLIHSTNVTEFEKNLKTIMNSCDPRFLKSIKDQIDNNTVEASTEVKRFILKIYYSLAPIEDCKYYLSYARHFENDIVKLCFKKVVIDAKTIADKIGLIKEYLGKYICIEEDRYLLIHPINQMTDRERDQFIDEIVEIIAEDVEKLREPKSLYMYSLFHFDNALDMLLEIGDDLEGNGYFNKWNILCNIIRKYFKSINDEKEVQRLASKLAEDYLDRPTGVQKCFEDKIFKKAFEFGKNEDIFIKAIEEHLGESITCQEVNNDKISSGKELFEFIEANPYTGPKWCSFIVSKIFRSTKKGGKILVEVLDKYVSDELLTANNYIEIFKEYASKIRENDSGISDIVQYFYDKRHPKNENAKKETGKSSESCVVYNTIEKAIVEIIVKRNLKQGGKNGIIYKFLFDFYKDECIKLFDL